MNLTDGVEWRNCPGEDNPADLGTCGITPSRLKESQLRLNGPIWITKESEQWLKQPVLEDTEEKYIEWNSKESTNKLQLPNSL